MIEGQGHYIVLMVLAGIMMGMVFDIYNTVTSVANWLRVLRSILDICFFAAFAYVVYHISLMTDNGRFRLYTFGLLLMGYALYRVFLHRTIVASAHAIIQVVQSIMITLWRLVFFLVIGPVLWFARILKALLVVLYRIGCNIEDIVCKCVIIIARILLFPFRGYKSILSRFGMIVQPYQEGIWVRLSNWLRRHPNGA